MKLNVKEVIEIIENEKSVLNAVIKGVENTTEELEDKDGLLARYQERVRECNRLILTFSTLLEDKETK